MQTLNQELISPNTLNLRCKLLVSKGFPESCVGRLQKYLLVRINNRGVSQEYIQLTKEMNAMKTIKQETEIF